jgi:hypothetical protein
MIEGGLFFLRITATRAVFSFPQTLPLATDRNTPRSPRFPAAHRSRSVAGLLRRSIFGYEGWKALDAVVQSRTLALDERMRPQDVGEHSIGRCTVRAASLLSSLPLFGTHYVPVITRYAEPTAPIIRTMRMNVLPGSYCFTSVG